MKRCLIIAFLFCFSCPCLAGQTARFLAQAPTTIVSGSYTLQDNIGAAYNDDGTFSNGNAPQQWMAGQWVAGSSYTLTQVGINLFRYGVSFSDTLTVYVYSDSGSNTPGSSLGIGSPTINGFGLPASQGSTYQLIQFTGVSIVSGTKYWIVINSGTIGVNAANCPTWSQEDAGSVYIAFSADGTSWSGGTGVENTFQTYSGGH